jgi:signal transduction histidine kinase/DNA-binding NarL/FixJ family response regulator
VPPRQLATPPPPDLDGAAARAAGLISVAEDLAGEFQLRPLLERILLRCTELLGCDAGSISSVDEAAGTYRKEADIGVACQSGQVFPLTEGMTGAVVAKRAPVWLARYDDVRGGHIAPQARASLRGVIGVPLEWRGRIIGACIVFSRDSGRVFGPQDAELLELFAKHAAIALANARMHEQAEARARAEAALAERDRLVAEVHDALAQRLASIRVHLDNAQRELAGADAGASGPDARQTAAAAAAGAHLQQASAAARDALAEARLTLLGLSASPLEGKTLEAALRSEAAWAESIGRLEVRFVSAGLPAPLDDQLALEVLRSAREALTNIVRHARARSVRLGLVYEQSAVSLLVQDDGQGFDPEAGWQAEHSGLRAMTGRARELGATFDVDSLPGWGTRIRARFPYLTVRRPEDSRLRLLVAAASPVTRAGLARLLAWTEPGIEVIAEVGTIRQALDACQSLQPDVALVDLCLPPGDELPEADDSAAPADGGAPLADGGAARPPARPAGHQAAGRQEVTAALLAADPRLAVVGLSESDAGERVASAMRAGARGCVDVSAGGAELARAVIAAARGQAILSGQALRQLHRGLRADSAEPPLTERERQVRSLMEQGLPDKLIAERLVLSVKTVEKHAGAVLRKTGARNRTVLAALAGRAPRPGS